MLPHSLGWKHVSAQKMSILRTAKPESTRELETYEGLGKEMRTVKFMPDDFLNRLY